MAFNRMCLTLVLISMLLTSSVTAARDLISAIKPGYNLEARLEASGDLVDCWNSLLEIKSCSNEIVLYFLNGQADIGPECCRAIGFITRSCWPAMLTSIGFTSEEGNILRGYCDASASNSPLNPVAAPAYPPLLSHTQSN